MRTLVRILVLAVLLGFALAPPALAARGSDSGSISRDAIGAQSAGVADPLGGPPTPRVFGLGQPAILAIGVGLLIVAAALGAYTLVFARRPPQ